MAEVMKHNTPSNSHSVENSEQEKTKILVWAEPSGINSPLPGREGGRLYRLMQFHLVDLESDKLHFDCIPSLLQCAPPSSVLAVDNSVYIFGTRFIPAYDSEYESDSDSDDIESGNKELQSFMSLPHDKAFLGASSYDLSSDKSHQTNGWCLAPIATRKRTRPLCASLDGKIYVFGSNYFQPEVLDPTVGHSTALDLPCELVGCKMSKYPLPDPSNRRILVHLFDGQLPSPSIYEFRLNDASCGGNWRCIAVDFHDWTNVAAVVDNAIYFYDHHFPNFIRAYDLASGTWLKICWKSKLKKIHGMKMYMRFDAMISLGNKILCFVVWLHVPEKKVRLHFFKFRVEQSGATVNLFPLESYSYDLPNTCEVQEFLPLQQDCAESLDA